MVSKVAKYSIYCFIILAMFFILAGNVALGVTATPSAPAKTSDGSLPCLPAMVLPLLAIGALTVNRTIVRKRRRN